MVPVELQMVEQEFSHKAALVDNFLAGRFSLGVGSRQSGEQGKINLSPGPGGRASSPRGL
jgi:hypothetical protein